MKRNIKRKEFHYITKTVSQGLPLKIKHKDKEFKFGTALLYKALELYDKGKEIVAVRVMKTLDVGEDKLWMCEFGMPIPKRRILDEFYYINI